MGSAFLVNFVYCHPIGHVVEGLHYAHGYHVADPDRRISMALNTSSAHELTGYAEFVERTYPIPVDLFDTDADHTRALATLPSTWDTVVSDFRGYDPAQRSLFPGLASWFDASTGQLSGQKGFAGFPKPVPYAPGEHLRLTLAPDPTRMPGDGPRIAILPGGSSPRAYYPSTSSWELVIAALAAQFPTATFCLVGKLHADERTATTFTRAELDRLTAAMPRALDVVDEPLVDQLAAVAACDVLVSPHTGFGMVALAVGTPWLTIGGNRWPEYFFNGVPFFTVIPDLDRFPCYNLMAEDPPMVTDTDGGERSPSMTQARIRADLDEIVDGAVRLIDRRWNYQTALHDHATRMLDALDGDRSRLWSIDNVLVDALG
ncbi:glycosyltransferase family 9 protein [Actinophytocola sediminis]